MKYQEDKRNMKNLFKDCDFYRIFMILLLFGFCFRQLSSAISIYVFERGIEEAPHYIAAIHNITGFHVMGSYTVFNTLVYATLFLVLSISTKAKHRLQD